MTWLLIASSIGVLAMVYVFIAHMLEAYFFDSNYDEKANELEDV